MNLSQKAKDNLLALTSILANPEISEEYKVNFLSEAHKAIVQNNNNYWHRVWEKAESYGYEVDRVALIKAVRDIDGCKLMHARDKVINNLDEINKFIKNNNLSLTLKS